MKKLNKVLAVLIILILIAGWTITVGGAGDKVGSIKDYIKLGLDLQGGVYVVMEAQTDASGEELRSLMTQTQAVIEKRVNEMGLTNPIVTIEGENRIRVELPGAEDAESAIEQIGKTAQLQFVLADGTVAVDGSNVKNAEAAINQQGAGYVVALEFDSEGATAFQNATQKIVNGEVTASEEFTNMGISANQLAIILDNEVISHPNVSVVISGGKAQIEGDFSQEEASQLSALIRGGSLPVGLTEVQTNIVGPSLGMDSLTDSIVAALIGVALVMYHADRLPDSGSGGGYCSDSVLSDFHLGYRGFRHSSHTAGHCRYDSVGGHGGGCQCHYLYENQGGSRKRQDDPGRYVSGI